MLIKSLKRNATRFADHVGGAHNVKYNCALAIALTNFTDAKFTILLGLKCKVMLKTNILITSKYAVI